MSKATKKDPFYWDKQHRTLPELTDADKAPLRWVLPTALLLVAVLLIWAGISISDAIGGGSHD